MKRVLIIGLAVFALAAAAPQELRDQAANLDTVKALLLQAADDIEALEAEKATLVASLATANETIAAKNAEIAELQARIEELEAQLPPPTPTPEPEPQCEGVQVAAGANLSTVANAQPAGTTFCLAAGTYTITSSVTGQQGDVFLGAGRTKTFLVGDGNTQHLMVSSGGADFEVRSLDISGAVGDTACQPNCGRAFRATGTVTLIDIRCHDNMNQCAGGGGGGVIMLDSECDNNGEPPFTVDPLGPGNPRSAACIKKASTGVDIVEVRNSFIHHNGWAGLWCDFCEPSTHFIIVDNVITDNASRGISWEASGGYSAADHAIVSGNLIQRNGLLDDRTVSSGITCNSCADITIENNEFGGNANNRAVGLVDARRAPWGALQNIVIRNNVLNGDTLPCSTVGTTCTNNA